MTDTTPASEAVPFNGQGEYTLGTCFLCRKNLALVSPSGEALTERVNCSGCRHDYCAETCFPLPHGAREEAGCNDARADWRDEAPKRAVKRRRADQLAKGEIPERASDLHAFPLHRLDYHNANWSAIHERQQILSEEVAYAKVLGRRGTPLDAEWTKDEDDPRLLAWRESVVSSLRDACLVVQNWRGVYGGSEHTTTENLNRLRQAGRAIYVAASRATLQPVDVANADALVSALMRIAQEAHAGGSGALDRIARLATATLEACGQKAQ